MKFHRFLLIIIFLLPFGLVRVSAAQVTFKEFLYSGHDAEPSEHLDPQQYRNPILSGFYPDPSVVRVRDEYYLINSTFAYFPGIPIFKSRDLVNWTQIGNVIDRPDQLAYSHLGVSRGIFAPSISYADGVFYVVCTMADAGGNFVVTASDPRGPWSNPTWLDFEGIDPSIFFDDDGRAWMINNGAPVGTPLYSGHRAIWIQEFDPVKKRMIGPRTVLVNGGVDIKKKPVWIEGPHLYKHDGWYFLCCAEGGTGPNHSQVVLRSRKVDGPYEPWDQNPILTQRGLDPTASFAVTSTGHANLVLGPDEKWWAVFLGVRPYAGRFSPMGRETFLLPVEWPSNGWPTILKTGERVPLIVQAPAHAHLSPPSDNSFLSGNFDWKANFETTTLPPSWLMLRTPQEKWWNINAAAKQLTLNARPEKLSGDGNPSFLARRVQHANFTASTLLEAPREEGTSGGLAVFQAERFHYYIGVKREKHNLVIFLEKAAGATPELVASATTPPVKDIQLRVVAHNATCAFEYKLENRSWQTLAANQDAKLFTTEIAGGFVGATVGLHARRE
jgi:alpha-N-arabinofuranosidase